MLTAALAAINAIKAYCENPNHHFDIDISTISDIAYSFISHGIDAAIQTAKDHDLSTYFVSALRDILDA
ncbi:MAG: hypothetical protein RL329_883 [Bacteroidota bacterium]|jgi:pterin-4a-carbinolamine dehydratase